MKTLKELLRNPPVTALLGDDSAAGAGLVYDSRAVGPGDCFFAVRGTQNDGHDFIPAAVAIGAAAVVCERLPEQTAADVVYVAVPDAAGALADMAAAFYDHPSRALKLVGITGTNARPSVAPTFGVEGMFGTNPLTVGIPTDEDFDFLIDCATSITQNGKIEYYARSGEDVHPGTVIGRDGQPLSRDSGEALKKIRSGDAALPTLGGIGEALGGYKGYGYAMVIELLSAVLQDGAYGKDLDGKDENGNIRPYHLGHFFIAIDTDHFLGQELTRKKAGEILRSVRASQKAPGADRIFTAGEKEWEIWQQRKDSGVTINDSVQNEI